MMCYKDKTFCSYQDCANFVCCERSLTEEVREQAIKWWGGADAPIATFIDRPECWFAKDLVEKSNV